MLWIVLCFSTGGLNAILGSFGFTYFRAGSRYSVVILAIVLLYAAQRLTALQGASKERIGMPWHGCSFRRPQPAHAC